MVNDKKEKNPAKQKGGKATWAKLTPEEKELRLEKVRAGRDLWIKHMQILQKLLKEKNPEDLV